MFKKNIAVANFPIGTFFNLDGEAVVTGVPTGTYLCDGVENTLTGTPSYKSTAKMWVWSEIPAGVMNGRMVSLKFELAGATPREFVLVTDDALVSDITADITAIKTNVDVQVSTRLAAGAYTAPANATIASIETKVDQLIIDVSEIDCSGEAGGGGDYGDRFDAIDEQLDDIQEHTDLITPGGVQVQLYSVYNAGVLTIARGASYTEALGTRIPIPSPFPMPDDITGWAVRLVIQKRPTTQNALWGTPMYFPGEIVTPVGPTKEFEFALTSSQSAALDVSNRLYEFTVELLAEGGEDPLDSAWAAGELLKPVIGDVIVMRAGTTS